MVFPVKLECCICWYWDDTTRTVWRHIMFLFCWSVFLSFKTWSLWVLYVPVGCNSFCPWNSRMVTWTRAGITKWQTIIWSESGPNYGSIWARDQSDKLMRVDHFHGVPFFSDGCGYGPAAAVSPVNMAIVSLNWANQIVCLSCMASVPEKGREKRQRDDRMACSKIRKVDDENQTFKDEWVEQLMFLILAGSSKPVCLICSKNVELIKSINVKWHYETKNKSSEQRYPLRSELRQNNWAESPVWQIYPTHDALIYSPATCKWGFTKGSVDFGAT